MDIATALKYHLTKNKKKFHSEFEVETSFGNLIEVEALNWDALMKEIEVFSEGLKKRKTK